MIGRVINNYQIKSVLAEGGMGKVYLAEHTLMGRRAAIKVLRGIFHEDRKMVARFINEARAANAIHHPNIVEMIDVGYLDGGLPYLMMEYLEGETLQRRLSRLGRLPAADAIRIIDQTASALEAAHGLGIIHRDLKPDNLFLVPDPANPGSESVKVVDFGIAKLLGPDLAASIRTSGVVLGTPDYMSPEQCRGTKVDRRTDVYALGVILYQALCGRPPFVAESQVDIMMMHVAAVPKAPRDLNPDIPPQLEATILRALAKRPDDRFDSMSALRQALGPPPAAPAQARQPPPVVAERPVRAPLSRILRRSPRWIWVLLALLAGVGVSWTAASRLLGGGGAHRPPPGAASR